MVVGRPSVEAAAEAKSVGRSVGVKPPSNRVPLFFCCFLKNNKLLSDAQLLTARLRYSLKGRPAEHTLNAFA